MDKKRFNLTQTLNSTPCASSLTHTYEREVVVHAHLNAGFYLLVPSTFLQGAQGNFLLRVHATCRTYLRCARISFTVILNKCIYYVRLLILNIIWKFGKFTVYPVFVFYQTFSYYKSTSFLHTLCSALKVSMQQECAGGEWELASVSGCWTVGSTAGGSRNFPSHGQNPHVPLKVTYDPGGTNVIVTLRQHSPPSTLHAIGFHIYKVGSRGGQTVHILI